jgi:type IV pilus assembly protein PilW
MKYKLASHNGYTLVELLVAMSIGIILIGGVIMVYVAQAQTYKVANTQASIQNAENAIAALVVPIVRAAGFVGCSTITQPLTSVLNPGAPPPLGTLVSPSMLFGYDANGTAGTGTLTIAQLNSANDGNAADWTPTLDRSLLSSVSTGSDVLVILGASPGSQPVAVNTINAGSNNLIVQDATTLAPGTLAVVSDCGKSTVFNITAVAGNTLTHGVGVGPSENSTAIFSVNYINPILVPMVQTAIYVSQGQGGQNVLTLANYINGAWIASPLVPGVDTMQVLYGVGASDSGAATQYVPASAITPTSTVYSVRLGFLLEGLTGSAGSTNPNAFSILGTTINVPKDTKLRRVYDVIVKLRNAA